MTVLGRPDFARLDFVLLDAALFKELCWHSFVFFLFTALGYLATAGGIYWFFALRRSSRFAVAPEKTSAAAIWSSVRHDVVLSIASSGIFAVCAALMMEAYRLGHTRLYWQPEQYGFGYLGFSFVVVLLLQDAYFYFTHRLAHHPKCYRWMHRGHHHFNNPTPWTAFSFDPAEALIQAIYLMLVTWLIPMHISVLGAVVMVMSLGALFHHLGVRLFKASAWGHPLGEWIIGPTHHWLHHRKYAVHYGLYFTFWDKLMGTQTEGYADRLVPDAANPPTSENRSTSAFPF